MFEWLHKKQSEEELYYEDLQRRREAAQVPSGSFQMTIYDVFTISGRGTVVIGKIESGSIHLGDTVYVVRTSGTYCTKVDGIETHRKQLSEAASGATVAILLNGVTKNQVAQGDFLVGSL